MADNTVTIKGTTSFEAKKEKGDNSRHEFSKGSFSRTITLAADVDSDKCKTSFKDVALKLTIPKMEKAKQHIFKVK